MIRLGVLLIVLGFGSLVLDQFNMEFRVLAWAEDYQPWVGIGIGVLGVLLIVIKALAGRGSAAETVPNGPAQSAPKDVAH